MAIGEERDQRREAEAAARFREDPEMERLRQLRDDGDRRFDALTPSLRMRLAFYERDRQAAGKAGKA